MDKETLEYGLGTALVALGGAIWRLSRTVKAEAASDQMDAKTQAAVSTWQRIAEHTQGKLDEAHKTIERVAKERNEAVQALGKLEATVSHLSEEVEELRLENGKLTATLQEYGDMLKAMREVNDHILDQLKRYAPSNVTKLPLNREAG